MLGVADAVPIPDAAAMQRTQYISKLRCALDDLEDEGRIAKDTFVEGRLSIAAGDAKTAVEVTKAIQRILSTTAQEHFSDMIKYQGTTPDHVSAAREGLLMDSSRIRDGKDQFDMLTPDARREMFMHQADELMTAKDALHGLRTRLSEAKHELMDYAADFDIDVTNKMPIVGLIRAVRQNETTMKSASGRNKLYSLIRFYENALPPEEVLRLIGEQENEYVRVYRDTVSESSDLSLLADGLVSVLELHSNVSSHLSASKLRSKERKVTRRFKQIVNLGGALQKLAALEQTHEDVLDKEKTLTKVRKALVKDYETVLERDLRHTCTPQEIAAYEKLERPDKRSQLYKRLVTKIDDAKRILTNPNDGLDALHEEHRSLVRKFAGSYSAADIKRVTKIVDKVWRALTEAEDLAPGSSSEFNLAAPLRVEEQMLCDAQDALRHDCEAFMAKYLKSKIRSVEELVERLEKIGKKTAKRKELDKLLRSKDKGKHSYKNEFTEAQSLLERKNDFEESERALDRRQRAFSITARQFLNKHGVNGMQSYEDVRTYVANQRAILHALEDLNETIAQNEIRIYEVASLLAGEQIRDIDQAQLVLQQVHGRAQAVQSVESEILDVRAQYVERLDSVLKKVPAGYHRAREDVVKLANDLSHVQQLRKAADGYQVGSKKSVARIRTYVRRQLKAAQNLAEVLEEESEVVNDALEKLHGPQD